jgi:hypothetical protein
VPTIRSYPVALVYRMRSRNLSCPKIVVFSSFQPWCQREEGVDKADRIRIRQLDEDAEQFRCFDRPSFMALKMLVRRSASYSLSLRPDKSLKQLKNFIFWPVSRLFPLPLSLPLSVNQVQGCQIQCKNIPRLCQQIRSILARGKANIKLGDSSSCNTADFHEC